MALTKKQLKFAKEIKQELIDIQKIGDTEAAHSMADNCLCELLNSVGFGDVTREWKKIDKWYA